MLSPSRRLGWATLCGLIYTAILLWAAGVSSFNLIVGNLTHMGIHMAGLFLALVVDLLANQKPQAQNRIKAVGAVVNAGVLVVLAGLALWQISRGMLHAHGLDFFTMPEPAHSFAPHLHHHDEVAQSGLLIFYVGLVGLALHLLSFFILRGGRKQCVNVRGAYIHLRFDIGLTALTALVGFMMHRYQLHQLDGALAPAVVILVVYSLYQVLWHAYQSYTAKEGHHHHRH